MPKNLYNAIKRIEISERCRNSPCLKFQAIRIYLAKVSLRYCR